LATTSSASTGTPVKLRRALTLWDLILYGVVVIQPTAPMPAFGMVSEKAQGHVVTAILIAMFAMLFTAISYGRMARARIPAQVRRLLMSGRRFIQLSAT